MGFYLKQVSASNTRTPQLLWPIRIVSISLQKAGLEAVTFFPIFLLELVEHWESSLCLNCHLALCLALLSGSPGRQRDTLPLQSIAHNFC